MPEAIKKMLKMVNKDIRSLTGKFFETIQGEISAVREDGGALRITVPEGLRRQPQEVPAMQIELPEELRADLSSANIADLPDELEMSFSSEAPVMRWGTPEILSHEDGDFSFDRFTQVGAILKNHNPNIIVGPPLKVWIDSKERKGRVRFRFGSTAEAQKAKREALIDKSLRGTSVGYIVKEYIYLESEDVSYKRFKGPAYIATKWEALEASLTPIAADPSVGVGRSESLRGENTKQEDITMDAKFRQWLIDKGLDPDKIDKNGLSRLQAEYDQETRDAETASAGKGGAKKVQTPASTTGSPEQDVTRAANEAVVAERERVTTISSICRTHGIDDRRRETMIAEGMTVPQARERVLTILANENQSLGPSRVEVGSDGRQSFVRSAIEAFDLRLRRITKSEVKHGGDTMPIFSLRELARECLRRANISIPADPSEMVKVALRGPAMMQSDIDRIMRGEIISTSTSDFPYILAATANKSMIGGYGSQRVTYDQWCKIGSLSDFKAAKRIKLSEAGDLRLILEGGKYEQTALSEDQNSIQVYTYGLKFNISRQMIINDDMSAFTTIPTKLGRAARRLPNILAVVELLTNRTLTDGSAVFSNTHRNLSADANKALDTVTHGVDGIKNLRKLLSEQRGMLHATEQTLSKTLFLGLMMERILVATEDQRFIADQVLRSATNPNQSNPGVVNPLQNAGTVIHEQLLSDSQITGYSTSAFFGLANPADAPVIEVAFLNGVQEPFMEEADQVDADGRVFHVREDCGAAAIDYAGMVKENGA